MAGITEALLNDPMGSATPSPQAHQKFGRIVEALLGGARNWVETPGRAMREGITTDQAVDWAAPTAMGMVGMSGLAGGAPAASSLAANPTRAYLPSSGSLSLPHAPTAELMGRLSRVEPVELSMARGTQPKMEWGKFDKGEYPEPLIKGYEDFPVAVRREDGEYLIFDGHHRAAAAMANGKRAMNMHVIDAKAYAPEAAGRKPVPDKLDTDELLRKLFE